MLRTLLTLVVIALLATAAAAQKRQRIGLEEGANSVSVAGRIVGSQYALYEIRVEKGDVWEVKLKSANDYIGYSVKGPNGDRYDFLEPAPRSGVYVIRVELNAAGAKARKPAAYRLDISFEMEPGKPLS